MSSVEKLLLLPHRAVYFASDFHLGTPNREHSLERERRIVRWLDTSQIDAQVIFLVGDIFDFWFEYQRAIPKGFVRLQGKLAELTDAGLQIILFTGNHDMWMDAYFTEEMGISVYRQPRTYEIGTKRFYIGHGDGLGPGDYQYKQLKKIFENGLMRWLFHWLHPDIGISIANRWSRQSRAAGNQEQWVTFQGEKNEWLWQYCKEMEAREHHDYYIFGHRHLPLDLAVSNKSRYINLGEWINYNTYARFDGNEIMLTEFKDVNS